MKPSLLILILPLFLASALYAQQKKPDWPTWHQLKKDVTVQKDLVYAEVDGQKLKLDLYRPANAKNGAKEKVLPGVLFIHGGGWSGGNKQVNWRQSAMLAREGYAVACMEYRLLPKAKILNCVEDAKAAVRWMRANAATYHINPERIGAIGGSAGGHLAGMLAVSSGTKELEGRGGNKAISSQIQAAVPMAMPSDLDNLFVRQRFKLTSDEAKLVSPTRYVNKDQAPMLLLHCKADRTVPYFSSSAFLLLCKGEGADIKLVEIKNGGHAFWHKSNGFEETLTAALPFLKKHLQDAAE